MKASTLIEKLQTLTKEYGDLQVAINSNEYNCYEPISVISIKTDDCEYEQEELGRLFIGIKN